LLNNFEEIEAGMVAGPATALVWSIENFFLAFVSRRRSRAVVKGMTRLCFSWLKHLDFCLRNRPAAMDGASCTYFLGRRAEVPVGDDQIISRYVGAQDLHHG
jgi:hypothetical protein